MLTHTYKHTHTHTHTHTHAHTHKHTHTNKQITCATCCSSSEDAICGWTCTWPNLTSESPTWIPASSAGDAGDTCRSEKGRCIDSQCLHKNQYVQNILGCRWHLQKLKGEMHRQSVPTQKPVCTNYLRMPVTPSEVRRGDAKTVSAYAKTSMYKQS